MAAVGEMKALYTAPCMHAFIHSRVYCAVIHVS